VEEAAENGTQYGYQILIKKLQRLTGRDNLCKDTKATVPYSKGQLSIHPVRAIDDWGMRVCSVPTLFVDTSFINKKPIGAFLSQKML
jgi:hypothetical protein